jgi:hypothetical protein
MFLTSLKVEAISDGKWVLLHELHYQVQGSKDIIVAPRGFVTDLASIPRGMRWFVTGQDETRAPSVIHDYLYQRRIGERGWADWVFLVAMKDEGVGLVTRWACYYAVRAFGWAAR